MESLSFKIAQSIAASLANAIREHGQASLVVSGGSSPLEIFAHLSLATISWDHVTIILGDDRLVDSKHKDSNELLIMRHLLINHAKASQYLSLTDSSLDAPQLKSPFDVVLLGMGLDGHFAGGWQSNSDLAERRRMNFHIIKVIERMRPDVNNMSRK